MESKLIKEMHIKLIVFNDVFDKFKAKKKCLKLKKQM